MGGQRAEALVASCSLPVEARKPSPWRPARSDEPAPFLPPTANSATLLEGLIGVSTEPGARTQPRARRRGAGIVVRCLRAGAIFRARSNSGRNKRRAHRRLSCGRLALTGFCESGAAERKRYMRWSIATAPLQSRHARSFKHCCMSCASVPRQHAPKNPACSRRGLTHRG